MRKIVEFFVKYPIWANSIIALIVVFGSLSYLGINKSFFPEVKSRYISVTMSYPGASPVEVEEGITKKIEEALEGIIGIEEHSSVSSENFVRVRIKTANGFKLEEVLTEVKNAIDRINSFPVSAEKPVVAKQNQTSRVAFVSLRGDVNLFELKKIAENIEDELRQSGVVSQLSVYGYPNVEISVEVPESNLKRYNLSFDQISQTIRENNRDISGGSIKTLDEEIRIRSNAKSYDPEIIENLTIRGLPDGRLLRIKDVASIKYQFADVPNKAYSNGQRSITLAIQKLPEEDLQEISEYIDQYITEFNEKNDLVELHVNFDFFSMLKERLTLLFENGGTGLLLVLLTLGIFLNLRLSFWVAWGIPSSFLGMFIIGGLYGITINMLSLFGMILVIGILVDDGIVIAENIYTHYEKGKNPFRAAVDGTMEVLPAVFASVLTTIVAFIPLIYIDNNGFTRDLSIVVIGSLFFSLIEAFLILPAHLSNPKIFKKKKSKSFSARFRNKTEKFIDFMRTKVYGKSLSFLIEWKWISVTVPIVFVMLVFGMMQGGIIKSTFFPNIPFDSFNINLAMKSGTREHIVEDQLRKFETTVWQVNQDLTEEFDLEEPFIKSVDLSIGSAFNGDETGSHAGNLDISFNNMEDKPLSSFEVAKRVQNRIGKVTNAEKFSVGGSNNWGAPFEASLLSRNMRELDLAAKELKEKLLEIPSLKDIKDNQAVGLREINIKLKPQAHLIGLTHNDISKQIRQGFFGQEAQRLQIDRDEVRVWVRYPENDRLSISQLEKMKIQDRSGKFYPLSELVTYDIQRGVVAINHYNGKREMSITADLNNPDEPVPPIIEKVKQDVLAPILAKYPSVKVTFGGQAKRGKRQTDSMMRIVPMAIVMMFLIIVLSFRSVYQAVLIFLLVPLGVFCAIFGHGIENIPVSILSFNGIIALSGVIINDAVVMLDQYNRNLKQGLNIKEAVFNAGLSRFRAIVLTSITTVVGLYPIILETSFQAQFLIPMAVSVAYGVLFGTMFILLFFPVLILVGNDIKLYCSWAFNYIFRGDTQKPSPEGIESTILEAERLEAIESDEQKEEDHFTIA
ncbi:efflux RND transporter permease subunit [Aureibacter tunicatorum]|uniref:Multidrug efflux pump subunit AcrB n=1 Tax=Aureibacter tunicatorum TaxID=866807 RepID=A0AAE4BTA0_9BACT|nr:efflux RND transporter permease subunit [Aureibacter tunicatorum]MDR6239337.1 multidrug efflux pump subunit AcrB [Aureibacter tunicatorum]BDD04740.1 acriflavin resistance protein [Aureibacter tunicatorum]